MLLPGWKTTWLFSSHAGPLLQLSHFLFSTSAVSSSVNYLFIYFIYFCMRCAFSTLPGWPLQLLFWNLIIIRLTCVCIWPQDLIFPQATQRHCCSLLLKAFRRTEGWGGGGWGYGEFAMFQICLQGAVSAFLDNTPVLGRQVANIFHIFFFCQDLLLLLSPTQEKLSGGKHQVKKSNQQKHHALATRGALLGAHTSAGCVFTSYHKKVPLWKSRDDWRLRILLVWEWRDSWGCLRPMNFSKAFYCRYECKTKAIWLHLYWRAGNQHNWCSRAEQQKPKLRSRSGRCVIVAFV